MILSIHLKYFCFIHIVPVASANTDLILILILSLGNEIEINEVVQISTIICETMLIFLSSNQLVVFRYNKRFYLYMYRGSVGFLDGFSVDLFLIKHFTLTLPIHQQGRTNWSSNSGN